MRELFSFGLGAPEICKESRGFAMAKVWSNVPGGSPAPRRYDLGRKTIETDDPDRIVGDVLNKIPEDSWKHVVGFTVLKFCGAAKHPDSRFERHSTFAFVNPDAEINDVQKLIPIDDRDGVHEALIFLKKGVSAILYNAVDFPITTSEYEQQSTGLTVVQAAAQQSPVPGLAMRTNIIMRPSVIGIDGQAGVA